MCAESSPPSPISPAQAAEWADRHFGVCGAAHPLPGEIDSNFRIDGADGPVGVFKVSRPGVDPAALDLQDRLLAHLAAARPATRFPAALPDRQGRTVGQTTDDQGRQRRLRLYTWLPGRLWREVRPVRAGLRHSLGAACGELTAALQGFDHPAAHRHLDWDVARAGWTAEHLGLFEPDDRQILADCLGRFGELGSELEGLRRGVVHNDANDHNVVVSDDPIDPRVVGLIDFGDAIHTWLVNDLAVALAYAAMACPDPLAAARPVVAGFHHRFPLQETELRVLHPLTAIRLVISVTKAALNRRREPDNPYLQVSETAAWALLRRWRRVPARLAAAAFREACGLGPDSRRAVFDGWAARTRWQVADLLPDAPAAGLERLDLSVGSVGLGHFLDWESPSRLAARLAGCRADHPGTLPAGGYGEHRWVPPGAPGRRLGDEGPEYPTRHLGIDFWGAAGQAVAAPEDGVVGGLIAWDEAGDTGPTVTLRHEPEPGLVFHTRYGHLRPADLERLRVGQAIRRGERFAGLGEPGENGGWPPHLHFQIELDPDDREGGAPGSAYPGEWGAWSAVCPDPNHLFREPVLTPPPERPLEACRQWRAVHLGPGLSLSYRQPLDIRRGRMQHLIAADGRLYLDTVNNVAHVGHEHPRVVAAGQRQMAVLNTNTRYLHPVILAYAEELLARLPPELSVLHFVNSGSEANELALRLAQAATGQPDRIVLESGYHGNTTGCIAISHYKFAGPGGRGAPPFTHVVPLPDSFRGRYRGPAAETADRYADHVAERVAELRAQGRGPAAFIAEAIVSCAGQVVLPDGYLGRAYHHVRAAGGVCVADEVQTGFGRVGRAFWAFELHGVRPDIVTMGKPIGNGHPLAAVACTRAVADAFTTGMEYFNTFGGNPVSCAIGREVLQVLTDERLPESAREVGGDLRAGLQRLQQTHPLIGDVRGEGLFLGFELVEAGRTPAAGKTAWLAERMRDLGILTGVDGPDHNVIKIKPPLCFSRGDADEFLAGLEQVLSEDAMTAPPVDTGSGRH